MLYFGQVTKGVPIDFGKGVLTVLLFSERYQVTELAIKNLKNKTQSAIDSRSFVLVNKNASLNNFTNYPKRRDVQN